MSDNQAHGQKFDEKTRLKVLNFAKRFLRDNRGKTESTTELIALARSEKDNYKHSISDSEFNLFREFLPHLLNKTTEAMDKFKFSTPFSKKLGKVTPANVNMVGKLRLESEEDKKSLQ
jgi:hypothetical protein